MADGKKFTLTVEAKANADEIKSLEKEIQNLLLTKGSYDRTLERDGELTGELKGQYEDLIRELGALTSKRDALSDKQKAAVQDLLKEKKAIEEVADAEAKRQREEDRAARRSRGGRGRSKDLKDQATGHRALGKSVAKSRTEHEGMEKVIGRMPGKLRGMTGGILKAAGGWGAVAAAVVGAVKKINDAINDWFTAQAEVGEMYKNAGVDIPRAIQATDTAQQDLNKSVETYVEFQKELSKASDDRVTEMEREAKRIKELNDLQNDLLKTEIDRAVSEGRMTPEEGDRTKAAMDEAAAERELTEEAKLLNAELAERQRALALSREEQQKARDAFLEADKALKQFEGLGSEVEQAEAIDPNLNVEVQKSIEAQAQARKKIAEEKSKKFEKGKLTHGGEFLGLDVPGLASGFTDAMDEFYFQDPEVIAEQEEREKKELELQKEKAAERNEAIQKRQAELRAERDARQAELDSTQSEAASRFDALTGTERDIQDYKRTTVPTDALEKRKREAERKIEENNRKREQREAAQKESDSAAGDVMGVINQFKSKKGGDKADRQLVKELLPLFERMVDGDGASGSDVAGGIEQMTTILGRLGEERVAMRTAVLGLRRKLEKVEQQMGNGRE